MQQGSEIGAYRVIRQIGAGGMGEVWLAEHAALGRRAAIKVLRPELSSRSDVVSRFFNEARAAAAIQDPGIVQIFDFGQASDGSAYIVMELLEGEPLDRRLTRLGALAVADAVRLMRQVANTLGTAHARGIVHRDLKPENIYIVRDPEVSGGQRAKILDFGIAKLTHTAGPKTQTAAMMGTPTYMSPEQCRGAGLVDARSDVYSLGCVLFQLVTGKLPFDAEGAGEIIAMHLREPAPLASSIAAHVTPELDALIARCLAKDPAQRFASAAELAIELGALAGTIVPASEPVGARLTPIPGATMTTLSSLAMQVPKPRGGGRWLVGGAVLAVLAAGVTFAVVRSSGDASETGSAAVPVSMPTPTPAPAPTPMPTPSPEPKRDERIDETTTRMTRIVAAFPAWAKKHPGAPCPSDKALGPLEDAWGHTMQITCTDQPAEQQMGVVSAGPDGESGTDDDIKSWELAPEVTAPVRGSHWKPKPPPPASKTAAPVPDCRQVRC